MANAVTPGSGNPVERPRFANVERKTAETHVRVELNIDGTGQAQVSSGVGFYDHMLTAFARHGRFDLTVQATGDLHIDQHHTMEDIALVLGQAVDEALGGREGITRMGDALVPLDEVLLGVVDAVLAAERRLGRRLVRDLCAAQFRPEVASSQDVGDHPVGLMLIDAIADRSTHVDPVDLAMTFLTGLFGLLATDDAAPGVRRRRLGLLVQLTARGAVAP